MQKRQKKSRPRAVLLIWISMIFFVQLLYGQNADFNEKDFFNNIKESYYNLATTGTQNFVALVTSKKIELFAKESWGNTEIFPLQLIWFNPDKLYLSQQGVPKLDTDKYKEYQEILNGLKMQLRGILPDLQRFYMAGFYDSIPQEYVLKHNEEAVQITFTAKDPGGTTKVKYLFGYNALNLLIEINYPEQNKQIVIYPRFKSVKTKWLCTGWSVQTYLANEVQSGFNLTLENKLVSGVWVPAEIIIEVQKTETKDKKYYDAISLRNFLFNQAIEFTKSAKTNQ